MRYGVSAHTIGIRLWTLDCSDTFTSPFASARPPYALGLLF